MVAFETLFQRLIYPKFTIDSISIEYIFEGIVSGLNSEIKINFLKYCSFKLATKEITTWEALIFEHFYFESIGRKKSFLYELEGGIRLESKTEYDKTQELLDTLMLSRKYELIMLIKRLPSLIEIEELNLSSQKNLNPNKRGSRHSFGIMANKIDLNLLFHNLITENYIPKNTSLTDFVNIFNQSNSSNIRPITWLGKKYHLLGLFRILLDEGILLVKHHALFERLKLYFVDKDNAPFNTNSWSSEFSRIFNSSSDKNKVELKGISKDEEAKLRRVVESSKITPK